jgi:hypothetical protein
VPQNHDEARVPTWDEIPAIREAGKDPYTIIDTIIQTYGIQRVEVQDCLRQIGAGSSPWIQLSHFLLSVRPARDE